jgi:hypothetical protein
MAGLRGIRPRFRICAKVVTRVSRCGKPICNNSLELWPRDLQRPGVSHTAHSDGGRSGSMVRRRGRCRSRAAPKPASPRGGQRATRRGSCAFRHKQDVPRSCGNCPRHRRGPLGRGSGCPGYAPGVGSIGTTQAECAETSMVRPPLSPDRDFIPVQRTGNLTSSSGRESAMPFDNPHHTPFGDAELLRDARSRVSNRNDWVQGRFQDGNRLCIVGALSLACGSRSFNTPNRVERRLARVLVSQFPSERPVRARFRVFPARQRLMWFNDDDRTSHADVMALFDRAIDRSTAQDFISL